MSFTIHLALCRPLLLLPSIFPSIRVFSNDWALCLRWPNYWSISFSISPSEEYSGLIFFRIDWFNLLAVQGSQESSPAPHLESINSLALSLLYSQTLTYLHDYWKNHSFNYRDQRYYVYSLRHSQDPAPRLSYCFLAAPSLSLLTLPSLTSNGLNLPFGTQGSSWRLESIPYKQEMGDTENVHT